MTGDTVLVQSGSGVVGRFAVEMAAWNGATMTATAGTDERAEIARRAGVEHVLKHGDPNRLRVLDFMKGRGVDRIVEVVRAAIMEVDARVIARHGRIRSYSSTSDRTPMLRYYDFARKGVPDPSCRLGDVRTGRMCRRARDGGTWRSRWDVAVSPVLKAP